MKIIKILALIATVSAASIGCSPKIMGDDGTGKVPITITPGMLFQDYVTPMIQATSGVIDTTNTVATDTATF